jgi:Zn-dependent oligopeptidase
MDSKTTIRPISSNTLYQPMLSRPLQYKPKRTNDSKWTPNIAPTRDFSIFSNIFGGVFSSSNPLIDGIANSNINLLDFSSVKPHHYPKAAAHFQSIYTQDLKDLEETLVNDTITIEYNQLIPKLEQINRPLTTLKNLITLMSSVNKDPKVQNDLHEANSIIQMNHEKSNIIFKALLDLEHSFKEQKDNSSLEQIRTVQMLLRPYRWNGTSLDNEEAQAQVQAITKTLMGVEAKFLQRSSLTMEEHGKIAPLQELVQSMYQILTLKKHLATLLGYAHHGAYSLDRHGAMAESTDQIKALHQEFASMAVEKFSSDEFQSSVLDMLNEFSLEQLNEYFEMNSVLRVLFDLLDDMFQIKIVEEKFNKGWSRDVRLFHIYKKDEDEGPMASFYIDPYRRLFKEQGCFVTPLQYRNHSCRPILAVCFDFKAPTWDEDPCRLDLSDVVNTFHEFGHLIQHAVPDVEFGAFIGSQMIEEDASEVISQLMEDILFDGDLLKKLSSHYQSGSSLSDEKLEMIRTLRLASKRSELLHRLFLGQLELELNCNFVPNGDESLISLQRRLAEEYCPHHKPPKGNIDPLVQVFQSNALGKNTMQYRYLWSEIISSDIFSSFVKSDENSNKISDMLSKGACIPTSDAVSALLCRDVSTLPIIKKYGLQD